MNSKTLRLATSILIAATLACGDDMSTTPADAGAEDAGPRDAATRDAGDEDAGATDAGLDAGDFVPVVMERGVEEFHEDGPAVSFTLALGAEPTGLVTITLDSIDENRFDVTPRSLRFSRATWADPLEVTLTPVDDELALGDLEAIVTWTAESADPRFSLERQLAPLPLRDDEAAQRADLVRVSRGWACAIEGGALRCWGRGEGGVLAHGDATSSVYPRDTGLRDVVGLSLGIDHGLALQADGTVIGWGSRSPVGHGSGEGPHAPAAIEGLHDVVQLVAGNYFSCARQLDGSVACWGSNAHGQLGDGRTTSRRAPMPVLGADGPLAEVSDIALAGNAACAVVAGRVHCWGANDEGQLGSAPGEDQLTAGPAIAGLTNVEEIVGGNLFFCARTSNGGVTCWGKTAALPAEPIGGGRLSVADVDDVVALAAGVEHACARDSTNRVHCWGAARGALFGNDQWRARFEGNPTSSYRLPTAFDTIDGGGDALCGVRSGDAHVVCYGAPGDQALAADGWSARPDVVMSPRFSRLTNYRVDPARPHLTLRGVGPADSGDRYHLDGGEAHTCLEGEIDQTMLCWGGDPASYTGVQGTNWTLPMSVASPHANIANGKEPLDSSIPSVRTSGTQTCFIERIRAFHCTGAIASYAADIHYLDLSYPFMRGLLRHDVGAEHFCGMTAAGTLQCWGSNDRLQRGFDATPSGSERVNADEYLVPGLAELAGVALGAEHSCALDVHGAVRCFGANDRGQCGAPGGDQVAPHDVGLTDAYALVAGGDTTCALRNESGGSGDLVCWGAYGLDTISRTPITNTALEPVRAVDLSPHRPGAPENVVGCALVGDEDAGALMCWGIFGGTWDAPAEAMRWESADQQIFDFSVSAEHVCWVGTGFVRCRGNSALGRLGSYDLYGPRVIRAE